MKIKCNVEKMKNAAMLTDRMTGKNLNLPILNTILIVASGKTLKLRSTNLTVGIEVELPALIEAEGTVAIKGDVLLSVCNNLPSSQDIECTLDNENLTIVSQKTRTVIKATPTEEFPHLPIVEGEVFEIKNTLFQEGIRSVFFAAATSEIKPEIASIFIYSEEGVIYFVATDSFRLAEKKIKIKNIPDISKILIPFKNVSDMVRALEAMGDTITVSYTRNQIAIRGNGIYFTSRLIDGGFPAYQTIIPKEENTKVVVMKQDLMNTLKLSTIFSDKFFQVGLTVTPEKKEVTISSKNSDVGSSVSIVDSVVEGDMIEVVVNLKYFMDVFQALIGDSVVISFTKPNKAILIKSVNDTSFIYLLMPTNR